MLAVDYILHSRESSNKYEYKMKTDEIADTLETFNIDDIEGMKEVVKVTVTHEQFSDHVEEYESNISGRPRVRSRFKTYPGTNVPLNLPMGS